MYVVSEQEAVVAVQEGNKFAKVMRFPLNLDNFTQFLEYCKRFGEGFTFSFLNMDNQKELTLSDDSYSVGFHCDLLTVT